MSLVVVVVIIGLAVVWKYSTPGNHTGTEAGWLGKLLDAPADPGTINFVPRPGLVLLLPLLPAPDLQVAGDGDPRHDRDPDDLPRAAARDAVHRRSRRASAVTPAGRDHRRRSSSCSRWASSPTRARPRRRRSASELDREDPVLGGDAGVREQSEGDRGRQAVRGLGLSQLPHVPRCRRRVPRRAEPDGGRREEQGHRVPDRASQVPRVREPRLADAVVPGARRAEPDGARELPRGLQGPERS